MRVCLLLLLMLTSQVGAYAQHILLFTKTAGFRHASIPTGVKMISNVLKMQGMTFVHTEDAALFHADSLQAFDVVIFLNTSGDLFTAEQKTAFQQYIRSGKGFLGIHAASDTEFQWPWFGDLVGGYFDHHPAIQQADIHVVDRRHPATAHLGEQWVHRDEWYNFKNMRPGLHVLMKLDESSYQGGSMGDNHPVAWCREFDGGRSFYTALGHTEESYKDPKFLMHILGGLKYLLQR